ncbi:MAG: restriction endonuclease subunit S [Bacteroidales bacterium]|nr:restriction endonuclease subunit S [Bacteroidales bacterium]
MNNWKQHKLGFVADVKLSNVDKLTNENERTVRLCNYTDVYKNSFIDFEKSENFMIASCNENEYEKFILKKGQVAITKDSETPNDIGVSTYISEDFEDVVLGYHLALITPDTDKLNGRFLHYWLNTKQAKRYFENNAGGSGQRCTLVLDCIKSTPLYLPNLSTQEKIAKVLSDLDVKIELNNRINRELEAMAKTLYDYWFVQFDFPVRTLSGVEGYKSSGGKMVYNAELKREIPEGWEVKTLAKVTAVSNESVNPMLRPEQEFKHYSIPTYDSTKTYGIEKGIDIRSNKFVVAESDILVSKLNPWFCRVIYPIKEEELICSTEFVVWRTSNTNIKNYLFMVAKGEHFISHCSQSATGTSNSHKRVNPTVMMRYKVPFNSELIQKFGVSINYWIKIGINKQLENKQLIELRDWLLPMLMNGQVAVIEAEEKLSMAAEPNVEYKKG